MFATIGLFVFISMMLYLRFERIRQSKSINSLNLTQISCRMTFELGRTLGMMFPKKVWVSIGEDFILIQPQKAYLFTFLMYPMLPLVIGVAAKQQISKAQVIHAEVPYYFKFLSEKMLKIVYFGKLGHFANIKTQIELRQLDKNPDISFRELVLWANQFENSKDSR